MKNDTLRALVGSNTKKTLDRVRMVAPSMLPDDQEPSAATAGVTELLDQAMAPKNLCRMEATWHAWY